jgi:formate dehydrogenase subunit gamma
MSERTLTRHNGWDIFIHWFNAACWLLLLITGLGLIKNEALNPLGAGYPEALRAMAGGGGNLLLLHEIIGLAWITGFVLYLAFNFKGAVFFLREVFSVSPGRDILWMVKKPVQMTLGDKGLDALGLGRDIPPQGFYNMGQKSFAQAALIGGLVIAATGVVMILSQTSLGAEQTPLVSWAIMLHYLFAGLVFAGLIIHVYMAAIAREERPGFWSMFTGSVPEDYARHHHALWYEKEKSKAAEKA